MPNTLGSRTADPPLTTQSQGKLRDQCQHYWGPISVILELISYRITRCKCDAIKLSRSSVIEMLPSLKRPQCAVNDNSFEKMS